MKAQERKKERKRLKQLKESQNQQTQSNQKQQSLQQEDQLQRKESKQISGPIMQIMSDDIKRQKSIKKKRTMQSEIPQQAKDTLGGGDTERNQIEELEKLIKMFNLSVYNNNIWIEQNNYYKSKLENEEFKQAIVKVEREIEELKMRNNQTTAAYIDTIQHCGLDLEKVVLNNAIELKKQNQMLQDEIDNINRKITSETEMLSKELKDNNILLQEIIPLEEELSAEIENVQKLKKELKEIKEEDGISQDLLNRINSFL